MGIDDEIKEKDRRKRSVSTSGWQCTNSGTIILLFGRDMRGYCEWSVISDVGEKFMSHITDGDLGTMGRSNQNFAKQLQKRHYSA